MTFCVEVRVGQLVELVDDAFEPRVALGRRRLLAQEHRDRRRQRRRARGRRLVGERDRAGHHVFRLADRRSDGRRVLTDRRVEIEEREIGEIRVGRASHRELRRARLRHGGLIDGNLSRQRLALQVDRLQRRGVSPVAGSGGSSARFFVT